MVVAAKSPQTSTYLNIAVTFSAVPAESAVAHQYERTVRLQLNFLYRILHAKYFYLAYWVDQTRLRVRKHIFGLNLA